MRRPRRRMAVPLVDKASSFPLCPCFPSATRPSSLLSRLTSSGSRPPSAVSVDLCSISCSLSSTAPPARPSSCSGRVQTRTSAYGGAKTSPLTKKPSKNGARMIYPCPSTLTPTTLPNRLPRSSHSLPPVNLPRLSNLRKTTRRTKKSALKPSPRRRLRQVPQPPAK
ncbi:hypothetical protein FA13DRAFT_320720 [Coprinellus micaceus]|uniref:Uncharacterized protein n=1 Tax=Coprinellus micaceus TaxID=71717 RepID=A0A4Y7TCX6_COPMI|nr:hypothetical protein FA13DRAFT_320720 [Coprinellus micaceus]